MFGLFRKNGFTSNGGEGPEATARLDVASVTELMERFPIGGKIRYYPEFHKDIVIDSIIIAYGLNDRLVYSRQDLHAYSDGNEHLLLLKNNAKELPIHTIESFCFVIPRGGDIEHRLDYPRKAELGPGGQFQHGNTLTLMALYDGRGIPRIDTRVRKTLTLKRGYYANHEVVVLDPLPESLTLIDQRQYYRLHTQIPVSAHFAQDDDPCPCTLLDFAEDSVKLRLQGNPRLGHPLNAGQGLILTMGIGDQPKTFVLRGKVLRHDEPTVVVTLDGILKGSHFVNVDLLDMLDIKASLLEYSATRRSLEDRQ